MSEKIEIVEKILNKNDQLALKNYNIFDEAGILSINLMASPGAGKTSLIEITIKNLIDNYHIAVVDGDIATNIDAERAAAVGATAVQINTGGGCHLDAKMLSDVIPDINLQEHDLLIIENVGNLICPASFPLGTDKSILIASIPEGDDKPYKYPPMYTGVDVLIINKIDLLPYIPFDMDYFIRGVEILNPGIKTFPVSCITLEGIDNWLDWLSKEVNKKRTSRSDR
jgi:hydrogenase nickel incorporation protein HypB